MNRLYAQMCEKYFPKVNQQIVEGLATVYMPKAEEYIDRVMRSAFHNLIPGLTYVDYERCTPQEDYEFTTRAKGNHGTYDMARTSIFLVKYFLKYNDEPLPPQYLYLPYVQQGGIMSIGGSKYCVTPVLSDKVISPSTKSIFVRLLQYKLNFYQAGYTVIVNGDRQAVKVVWSSIYNQSGNKQAQPTTKALTCLAHYLFGKYGLTETFRRYAGFVPVVGTTETITEATYSPAAWVIVETAHPRYAPPTYIDAFYEGSKVRLAIPKDHWNAVTKSFVSSFFYVVDHFPEQMLASYVDNVDRWKLLLAYILFSAHYTTGNLMGKINEHYVSLDSYVDAIATEKLAEKGYHITNFFDLLGLLISKYDEMLTDSGQADSMYGKYLDVLYYAMLPITMAIFTTKFALMKAAQKPVPPATLQLNNVKDVFTRKLTPGPIFKLSSDTPVTESVAYSGDHPYLKLTSKIAQQASKPTGKGGRGRKKPAGESEYLNASMIEGGSILFLAKSNPRPTNRGNMFLMMDLATGTILENPKFKDLLAETQFKLSQK